MKLFKCQYCEQLVYFENHHCESCSHRLGYLPDLATLSALEPDGDAWGDAWRALADNSRTYKFCSNATLNACNWLLPTASTDTLCTACRHNWMIPDLSLPENLAAWLKLEQAKHRLVYSLSRLRLPLANRRDDPEHGLAFEFLVELPYAPKVMTGHDNGLITLALKEADDVERERMRQEMGEPYRTLLGHFRHEVGHYFWDVLVRDGGKLDACRALFGDDTEDYGEALRRHYRNGSPPDWQNRFVSAYASSHPWEDFAETWAHYLHIVDTLEMASAFGLRIHPRIAVAAELHAELDFDPYRHGSIERLVEAWLPLTFAINSLNRSMGQPDLYPFVLSPSVIGKLGFIHALLHDR
ncbi:MAG TPA: putative zinc-binding peptidase [Stellaceae bacterium]|nr:putative zinc-binding peptidase [Stellaceae bacterium]